MISRRRFLTMAGLGAAATVLDVRALITTGAGDAAFAAAAPARGLFGGPTTLDQTVDKGTPDPQTGYFTMNVAAGGEAHTVRTDLTSAYAHPVLSLGAFAQMTDLHVVDDQSPARVEFTDKLADPPDTSYDTASAYRPHEMLSTHIVEAMVQAIRNVRSGPMTGLPLAFTIVTGDMVDNMQYNEVRWYIDLLDGGKSIRADSGQIGTEESVSGHFAAPGVLVHDHYYWSPDGLQQGNNLPDNYHTRYGFPTVPGLLPAARRPYTSTGLGMPWYAAMGNHDGEIQGNYPVDPSFLEHQQIPDISDHPASPQKAYDSRVALQPNPSNQNIADFINNLLYVPVTADERRKFLPQSDFAKEHYATVGLPAGHGFPADGSTYYAIPSGSGDLVRYLTLDTVNYDGNAGGRLKGDQYDWLEARLVENSSHYIGADNTPITQGGVTDKLYVIFCHHTLATLNNDTGDIITHDSVLGPAVERLLLRFPNVILMVNGHTHANGISAHARNATTPLGNLVTGAPGGFWEVNTAAHIDWPSQSRIVELAAGLANPTRQTVSVFTTMVDISAPAGFNGDTSTPTSLASLARELAANDPTERLRPANASRAGRPADRNTQLLVPAPFDLPLPQRWGSSIALATNQDGRLQLFGTNPLDGIYQQAEQTAGSDTWAGWNQIAGSFRAVSAETAGDGRIALAATNSAGVVFYTTQTTAGGTAMNSWTLLGPADARSVALARNSDGHMEVFVVLGTGQVWHIWQTSAGGPFGAWSTGFGRSGTRMVQATVATNSDGRVELFLLDASGGIWHRAEILAGGWTDWTALAAPANTWFVQLTVATNRNGQLQLFLIDNGRRIWTGRQTSAGSATWTAFSPLDPVHGPQGRMTQLTARLGGTGLVELFGVDHASGIWYRRQTATNAFESWTAWTSMWGVLRSDVPAPPPGSTIGNPPPQAVTVPRIVDQTTSDADAILINAGLTVGKTATTGTCIGKGLVYSQSPTPGKVVDAGTPVNYTYATC